MKCLRSLVLEMRKVFIKHFTWISKARQMGKAQSRLRNSMSQGFEQKEQVCRSRGPGETGERRGLRSSRGCLRTRPEVWLDATGNKLL